MRNRKQEFECPTKNIQSEGDKYIKDLFQKQSNHDINLKTQLLKTKEFECPKELIRVTDHTSGQTNLPEFQKYSDFVTSLEKFKYFGLTAEEIEIHNEYHSKGVDFLFQKHKNLNRDVLKEKLDRILLKIHDFERKEQDIQSSQPISRHLKDLALCVKPQSVETKLYNFALTCSTSTSIPTPLNHPINHLPELESKLFDPSKTPGIPDLKKRRKKAKKFLDKKPKLNDESDLNPEGTEFQATGSKWDLKTPIYPVPSEKKQYLCKPLNLYTIKDNQIVKLHPEIDKAESNLTIKLTEVEIKALPRFQNYEKGIPTNVLYIKNLANNIKETDLNELFSRNKITGITDTRLLTGKMKGQAFITFNSSNLATEALENLNGTVMKGKPIIIQFGKSK